MASSVIISNDSGLGGRNFDKGGAGRNSTVVYDGTDAPFEGIPTIENPKMYPSNLGKFNESSRCVIRTNVREE